MARWVIFLRTDIGIFGETYWGFPADLRAYTIMECDPLGMCHMYIYTLL